MNDINSTKEGDNWASPATEPRDERSQGQRIAEPSQSHPEESRDDILRTLAQTNRNLARIADALEYIARHEGR